MSTIAHSQTIQWILTAGLILAMQTVTLAGPGRVWAEGPVTAQNQIQVEAIALEPAAGNNGRIFAIIFGALYSGTDGGAEWRQQAADLNPPLYIASLATDPENPLFIYLGTYHDSLFRSDDGGLTFLRASGGLGAGPPVAVTAILAPANLAGLLLAATASWVGAGQPELVAQGLYLSTNWGLSWFQVSDAMGETPVNSLALDRSMVITARSADGSARRIPLGAALADLQHYGSTEAQVQASMALALLASRPGLAEVNRQFWTGQDMPATAARLASLGTPGAIRTLVNALADAKRTPRQQSAMQTLEYLGEKAVPALIAALSAENPILRGNAAEMLGWIASTTARPALTQAIADEDLSVRAAAAWALSEIR